MNYLKVNIEEVTKEALSHIIETQQPANIYEYFEDGLFLFFEIPTIDNKALHYIDCETLTKESFFSFVCDYDLRNDLKEC
jgi:hypothetical protein